MEIRNINNEYIPKRSNRILLGAGCIILGLVLGSAGLYGIEKLTSSPGVVVGEHTYIASEELGNQFILMTMFQYAAQPTNPHSMVRQTHTGGALQTPDTTDNTYGHSAFPTRATPDPKPMIFAAIGKQNGPQPLTLSSYSPFSKHERTVGGADTSPSLPQGVVHHNTDEASTHITSGSSTSIDNLATTATSTYNDYTHAKAALSQAAHDYNDALLNNRQVNSKLHAYQHALSDYTAKEQAAKRAQNALTDKYNADKATAQSQKQRCDRSS